MFVYIKTSEIDPTLTTKHGSNTIPIMWVWDNLASKTAGWVAATYFVTFLTYLSVSVAQLIVWILYLTGTDYSAWTMLNSFFFYTFAWYAPSWIFPLLHMYLPKHNGGLAGRTPWGAYQSNDFFYFMVNFVMWVYIGGQHFIYSRPLHYHLKAIRLSCKCEPVEYEDNMGPKHKDYVELVAQKACYAKCPSKAPRPEADIQIVEEQPEIGEAGDEIENNGEVDLF